MKLWSFTLLFCLSVLKQAHGAEEKSPKTSWVEQKIEDAKKAAQKKLKKKKDKLKKLIGQVSSIQSEEDLDYLCYLQKNCMQGSLEAVNEGCELFGVDNIFDLEEAFCALINQSIPNHNEETLQFSLCGKYIGDDGLEYDDGLDDEQVEAVSFYSIPLHQWEKKIIEKIVSSLAEKTLAQLLLDRKEMEKRGDQVRHVHPLRFMGYVFHDPYLKSCLPQFKNSAFKWSNFIDGFVQKMREEMANDNINKHLEGFCHFLNIDLEKVSDLVSKGQYEDLIYFLMEV